MGGEITEEQKIFAYLSKKYSHLKDDNRTAKRILKLVMKWDAIRQHVKTARDE